MTIDYFDDLVTRFAKKLEVVSDDSDGASRARCILQSARHSFHIPIIESAGWLIEKYYRR